MNQPYITVLERAIDYAEKAQAREQGDATKKQSELSWHLGRAGAYEDMAGMLRMGLAAVKEAVKGG